MTLSFATLPFAFVSAQAPAPETAAPATEEAPEIAPEKLIETYGFVVGLQSGIRDFELTEEEYALFLKGLNRAQAGEAIPENINEIMPQLQSYLGSRQAEKVQARAAVNREEAEAFFAELAEKEGVQSTPEGLYYQIEEEGEGESPEPTSTVRIHYEGRLLDGTVFDSSYKRGEPAEFPMSGVIPGMTLGLSKMKEGGKATLYIPADLAYGDQSQPTIPPGSALIFEVELIEVLEGQTSVTSPPIQMP